MNRITSQETYEKGLARMEDLLKIVGNDTDPQSKEFQELDELSDRVAEYEELNYSFKPNNPDRDD